MIARRMGQKNLLVFAALLLVFFSLLAGCGNTSSQSGGSGGASGNAGGTIKIGLIGPLSGQLAEYGLHNKNGAQLAVDEINASGGINGKKLELVVRDDQNNPTKAATYIRDLLQNEKIDVLISAQSSQCYQAIEQQVLSSGLPTFLNIPTETTFIDPKKKPNVFRIMINNAQVAEGAVQLATKLSNNKKVAIISDTSGASKEFIDLVKKGLSEKGYNVTDVETYNIGDVDMTSQVQNIKKTDADTLVMFSAAADAAYIVKALDKIGYSPKLIGRAGIQLSAFPQLAGNALKDGGMYSVWHKNAIWHTEVPQVKKFVDAYKAKYGNEPIGWEDMGYDAVYAYKTAVERAGSTEAKAVIRELEKLDLQLVEHISFTPDRHEAHTTADISFTKFTRDPNAKGFGNPKFGVFTDATDVH